MAQLKHHLLYDIYVNVLAESLRRYSRKSVFPGIGNFVLSGKGPIQAFRWVVARHFAITHIQAKEIQVEYQDKEWKNEQKFLNRLFAQWARKVKTDSFKWFDSNRKGYRKLLCKNRDVESICIDLFDYVEWRDVFKAFPHLVCLKMSLEQFGNMLYTTAELDLKLTDLNEVVLSDFSSEEALFETFEIWHKYKSTCTNIETIRFDEGFTMKSFQLPESDITFPSVKHLDINILETKGNFKLDFGPLTAVQKIFPSLEKVRVEFESDWRGKPDDIEQELEDIELFYSIFESLSFGFFLEVLHHEAFHRHTFDQVHNFLSTKGRIERTGCIFERLKLKVHSSYPNKSLIYATRDVRSQEAERPKLQRRPQKQFGF